MWKFNWPERSYTDKLIKSSRDDHGGLCLPFSIRTAGRDRNQTTKIIYANRLALRDVAACASTGSRHILHYSYYEDGLGPATDNCRRRARHATRPTSQSACAPSRMPRQWPCPPVFSPGAELSLSTANGLRWMRGRGRPSSRVSRLRSAPRPGQRPAVRRPLGPTQSIGHRP